MLNTEQTKEHLKKGQPTKYNEEAHINLLVDVFCDGDSGSIAKFCAEALIKKSTFHNWKKAYPKFKDAYDVVINVAEAKWEDKPFNTPSSEFNYQHWALVMRNRFGFGKPVIDLSEVKTPQERIEIVIGALGNGELNIDEATKLANLVGIQADVGYGEIAMKKMTTREEYLGVLAEYNKSLLNDGKKKAGK